MYRILVSSTFQKEYRNLDQETQIRIKRALENLNEDPFTPRPHADLKPLKDTDPTKYRLRVGKYRIIYAVNENEVNVLEIFSRERGYQI